MARPKLEHEGTEYVCIIKSDLPHEIALLFAEMSGKDQADFFSYVALAADRWEKPQCFQWAAMTDEMDTTARRLLSDMADYVKEQA